MVKSRNKKTVKLSSTIIDIPHSAVNLMIKGVNTQRWNFSKKSQDHLKFRYKYYQSKSINTTSLSNKQYINPETLYNTIVNKWFLKYYPINYINKITILCLMILLCYLYMLYRSIYINFYDEKCKTFYSLKRKQAYQNG